jgi:uncharacterized protein
VGLTKDDIISQGLPLPARDMLPLSPEEKIICCADLFYSKNPDKISHEKTIEEVMAGLATFGADKLIIFEGWLKKLYLE